MYRASGPMAVKPWTPYAQRDFESTGAPQIAIIVGGLGLNTALTERAIDELPSNISLAFAPYAKNLDFWTRKARQAGHEVIIELPMEGYGGNPDALGAAGLLTSRKPQDNLQRLDWLLARFGGYFAATNYQGAKFSTDPEALATVMKRLRQSGVAYIDDTGAALDVARKEGAAVATVSRVIPPAPDDSKRSTVRRELRALEQTARKNGAALGKTYAYATTIDEISAWAKSLQENGFEAAPASAVLQATAANR